MKSDKKKNWFWLRLLLSVLLITFISTTVEFNRLFELFSSARLSFFLLALALVIAERLLLAYKWNVLLATKKMNLPFLTILKIYYLGTFIGTFLPTSLGGDIFRCYKLYKYNSNLSESISSVVVERMVAIYSSLSLSLTSILLFSSIITNQKILPTVLIMVGTLVVFSVFLLNKSIMQFIINRLNHIRLQNLQQKVRKFHDAFSEYTNYKSVLFYVLILSFLFQFIRIVGTYIVYLSIDHGVHIIYFFIFVPIIIVLAMLPIAVGGIGVREGAFIYFFSQVGMSTSEAFALSLLLYLLVMISIIPGGIIYVTEGFTVKGEGVEIKKNVGN